MQNRDIVVIGGSAGALPSISMILQQAPPDFRAAILIVLHMHPSGGDWLPGRLSRISALPIATGVEEPLRPGRVYVGLPDRHLIVKPGRVISSRGPYENQWRPAIDVLFRTAAVAYTSRVIGVLLSGELDDGTSGLEAIKRCGGVAVVQHPGTALHPTMPQVAAANVRIDHLAHAPDILPLLLRLIDERAPAVPAAPTELQAEALIAEGTNSITTDEFAEGQPTALSCPECGGPLWILDTEGKELRCLVGHSHRIESLQTGTDAALDRTLWAAIRQFEQRANIARMMAQQSHQRQQGVRARLHEARARESQEHAQRLRELQAQYRSYPESGLAIETEEPAQQE